MWDWLSIFPYLAIVALVAFFFILIISVSLLEKQRIRQLEAVPRDSLVPTSSYFDAMNEAAAAHGYTSCGAYARIPRNAFTNAYMAAWLSPDRTTLACVMGGKVAKANYRKTLLVSWIEEEKFLVTRDDFGETDPSKILEIEVVLNADFSELSTRHAQRLAGSHARPKLLDPVSVTMYWERMEEIRAKKPLDVTADRPAGHPEPVCQLCAGPVAARLEKREKLQKPARGLRHVDFHPLRN